MWAVKLTFNVGETEQATLKTHDFKHHNIGN